MILFLFILQCLVLASQYYCVKTSESIHGFKAFWGGFAMIPNIALCLAISYFVWL